MKILILGHAQHGKDTLAGMITKHTGFTFKSSSEMANELFVFDNLKERYGYKTHEECYNDRGNHRQEWFDLIDNFNKPDRARLAKEILTRHDGYIGMRNYAEYVETKNLFDLVIGIWTSSRPYETQRSFNINIYTVADIVICNMGTLDDLENKVKKLKPLFVRRYTKNVSSTMDLMEAMATGIYNEGYYPIGYNQ